MRCYKVSCETNYDEDDNDGIKVHVVYAGTNALAREAREAMVETYDVKKKDVTIEDADIPTAKADLLEFINGLLA